jgi:hypothetical protein
MKCVLSLVALAAVTMEAHGLITPAATAGNSAADATYAPASVWDNVGFAGDSSGMYLGNGWIVTANHVSRTDATHIDFKLTLGGVTYSWSGTGFQLGGHDIFLAKLNPDGASNLPDAYGATGVTIPTATPAVGTPVTMIGYGRTSSATTYYTVSGSTWTESNQLNPLAVAVYTWGPTPTKTWGTNTIWGTSTAGSMIPGSSAPLSDFTVAGDKALSVDFTEIRHGNLPASHEATPTAYETAAALNDSGSGLFASVNGSMQLVGLTDTVLGWNGQPGNTTTASNYTMAIDLTSYAAEINAYVVPEPGTSFLLGGGLVSFGLGRWRSRRRQA